MPVHGYSCNECGTEFEVFYLKMSDVEKEEPVEKCPKCDSTNKERLPPKGASFQLRGKGWARDNYD